MGNFKEKEEVKMVMEVSPKELDLMLHSFELLTAVVEVSLVLNLEVILELQEANQLAENAEAEVEVDKDLVEE